MTGERPTKTGWQTYVWVQDKRLPKGGRQVAKNWPLDSKPAERAAWRTEQELRGKKPELFVAPTVGLTFATEAEGYLLLPKVLTMPTVKERVKHIREWIAVFGTRERASLTGVEIQQQLDRITAAGYAASSVNNRRTALMDLWTTLDGRSKANPVKDTRKVPEPDPEPRAPAMVSVLTLLDKFPAKTDYGKKCRARLKVIAWTGWPHAIVKTLEPGDAKDWKEGRAYVRKRRKGKGSKARWLPLLPEAQKALAEFDRVDAYGRFSNSSLRIRVNKAIKALKLPSLRVYDLRHWFGSLIATLTQDERALAELMLVTDHKVLRRYTLAATDPRVQAAVASVVQQLPGLLAAVRKVRKDRGISGQARSGPSKTVGRKRRNTQQIAKLPVSARSSIG